MKRAGLLAAAIVAGLVVAALVAVFLYVDVIARRALERGATYALGVETQVASTRIGLLSGSFGLLGLEIANPPGFEAPRFLGVRKAQLGVDVATLRQPTVIVPLLAIGGVEVDLDQRGGKANYAVILDNLGRFESREPAPPPDPNAAPAKSFVVRELVIRDVVAHVRVLERAGGGAKLDVVVPEVRLRNLGGAGRPLTAAQLSDVVVKAVLASIAKAGAGLPGGVASALRGELGRLASVSVELPQGGELRDSALGAVGAGADAARDAGKSAADAGRRTLESLGGKLRGKKD